MESENMQECSYKEKKKCNGMIGVPITFMDKYCLEQFEVVGITKSPLGNHLRSKIYNKQIQYNPTGTTQTVTKANDGAVIKTNIKPSDKPYYEVDNKILLAVYPRILIKRKENVDDSKNI